MTKLLGKLTLVIILTLSFTAFTIQSNALAEKGTEVLDHSHMAYDTLLKKYVQNARVDYKGFIASEKQFDSYLRQLGSVSESDYTNWSRDQKLAFWINAYNAFTIKAIIDNYPIEKRFGLVSFFYPKNSIRQIDGIWDKIKFRAVGKMVTLNQIEHEILRKEFKEPRIHVAIVCASVGCPDLRSEAYTADRVNEQLESQSERFVNNPSKGVQIDTERNEVKLSKIFDWFGKDFVEKYGNTEFFKDLSPKETAVLNFAIRHLKSEEERKFLESDKFKISYLDYDWSLNEMKEADSPSAS
ncbi:MAG: DUF547 domain-containing protein [Thermodesulfobacteriota bacterium]